MAVVAAAITAERLVPAGERVARAIGAAVIGAGLLRAWNLSAAHPRGSRSIGNGRGWSGHPDEHGEPETSRSTAQVAELQ